MTWIKICGTTNLEDAQLAVDAGADALGFIFAPSPRRITPAAAAEIIRTLPPAVAKVGIFANGKDVASIAFEAGLSLVQIYGDASPNDLTSLESTLVHVGIIKAMHGERFTDDFLAAGTFTGPDRFILLDNTGADSMGGTGKAFDWGKTAAQIQALRERFKFNFIIAGGLTPENVGEAIQLFRPWGVDVVSGVESKPGKKDPQKLRAFIRAVREAEKSL